MEDDLEADIITLDDSSSDGQPPSASVAPSAAMNEQQQQQQQHQEKEEEEIVEVVINTEEAGKPKQKFTKLWSADEIIVLKEMWRTQGPEPWNAFCDALRERGINKSNRQILNQAEQLKLIPEQIAPMPGAEQTDAAQTKLLAQNAKITGLLQPTANAQAAAAPVAADASAGSPAASSAHYWSEAEDQLLRDLLERAKTSGERVSRAALAREAISRGIRRSHVAVERRLKMHEGALLPAETPVRAKRTRLSSSPSLTDDTSIAQATSAADASSATSVARGVTNRGAATAAVSSSSTASSGVSIEAVRNFVGLLQRAAPASIDPATSAAGRECGWQFVPVDEEMQVEVDKSSTSHVWLLSNIDPSSNTADHAQEGLDFFRTHEALAAFLQEQYGL